MIVVIRRAALYLVALCVGTVAARVAWRIVEWLYGPVTGFAAIVFTIGSLALFVVTTAWVFSVLAAPKTRRSSSTPR